MSDDLIEELNNVLKSDKDNGKSTKLQSYFCSDTEKDDLFSNIVHDTITSQSFEENLSNIFKQQTLDEYKKSVRFSDNITCNNQSHRSAHEIIDMNYPGSGWLNSENTKCILAKIFSKEMSSNLVNKSLLARPQLYTDPNQRLPDPIFSLLHENYNYDVATEMRKIPSIDDCMLVEKDVLLMLEKGWIRPAIDLTSRILNKMGFTYAKSYSVESVSYQFTVESGRLWCLRFALLARMKLLPILESELSGFQNLDCPNLYSEFYSDNTNVVYIKGSLIPFSMRLIYAELPLFFNKFSEALNRLYYILAVIKRILINIDSGYSEDGTNLCTDEIFKSNALKIWQKRRNRVLISCMRVLIASKDYPSVIDVIHNLINNSISDLVMSYSKDVLYHLFGRVYLQLGDVDNAGFYFEQSLSALKENLDKESQDEAIRINNVVKFRILFQNALLNISRNNFEEAKRCFQQCLELQPNNTLVLNNYSVCCLYLKQVQEAICNFEKLLKSGIRHDGLIFNLCILYELQTNQIKSRKLKIVKILSEFQGDDFHISSFKLTNSE